MFCKPILDGSNTLFWVGKYCTVCRNASIYIINELSTRTRLSMESQKRKLWRRARNKVMSFPIRLIKNRLSVNIMTERVISAYKIRWFDLASYRINEICSNHTTRNKLQHLRLNRINNCNRIRWKSFGKIIFHSKNIWFF